MQNEIHVRKTTCFSEHLSKHQKHDVPETIMSRLVFVYNYNEQ